MNAAQQKLITVPIAKLVEDYNVYPRNRVEDMYVNDMRRAMAAGAKFPPVVVDADTLRIVDGFHRASMYRKELGESAEVEVLSIKYPSESALFLDAARRNSRHGRRMDRHDEVRVTIVARELGASRADIAVALGVTEQRVEDLSCRVARVRGGGFVPLKLGVLHKMGSTITRTQAETIHSLRGTSTLAKVNELRRILRDDLADMSNAALIDSLKNLGELISERLQGWAA